MLLVGVAGRDGQVSQAWWPPAGTCQVQGALQPEDPRKYRRAVTERLPAAAVDLPLAEPGRAGDGAHWRRAGDPGLGGDCEGQPVRGLCARGQAADRPL